MVETVETLSMEVLYLRSVSKGQPWPSPSGASLVEFCDDVIVCRQLAQITSMCSQLGPLGGGGGGVAVSVCAALHQEHVNHYGLLTYTDPIPHGGKWSGARPQSVLLLRNLVMYS